MFDARDTVFVFPWMPKTCKTRLRFEGTRVVTRQARHTVQNAPQSSLGNFHESSKTIVLYDHLPGILAAYPAVIFAILALLALPQNFVSRTVPARVVESLADSSPSVSESGDRVISASEYAAAELPPWVPNPHMLFWISLSVMIVWYIAYRFDVPKGRFVLLAVLFFAFVAVPVVFEMTRFFRPSPWLRRGSRDLHRRSMQAVFLSCHWYSWRSGIINYLWSRTHARVVVDAEELVVNQLRGKPQKFELAQLHLKSEPQDYLEYFLAGIGSLSFHDDKEAPPVVELRRVIGLYRIPVFPFFPRKIERAGTIFRSGCPFSQ